MKVSNISNWVLTVCAVLFGAHLFAQTVVNMPLNAASGPFSPPTAAPCYANFFDNGGAGNYSSNSAATSVTTFAPSSANSVLRMGFTATSGGTFQVENNWDALYVYDGATTGSALISSGGGATIGGFPAGGFTNANGPFNKTIVFAANPGVTGCPGASTVLQPSATNTAGSLTFQFRSDASVAQAGWKARVIEIPKQVANSTMAAAGNATIAITTATACLGVLSTAPPTVTFAGIAGAAAAGTVGLTYSLNGGAQVLAGTYTVSPASVQTATTVPASVTIGGIPAGASTVTWRLIALCAGAPYAGVAGDLPISFGELATIAGACQGVQASATGVTLTCPSNSTITLPAGDCAAVYNYDACAASCSGFAGPITVLDSPNPGWTQQGQNTYFFNITNTSTSAISLTSVDPRMWGFGATSNLRVFVTAPGGTYVGNQATLAAWTQVASYTQAIPTIGIPANGALCQSVPLALTTNVSLAPGETRGVAMHSSFITGGGPFSSNSQGATTYTDGKIKIDCGPGSLVAQFTFGTNAAAPFAGNWSYTGGIKYQANSQSICYTPGSPFFIPNPANTPAPGALLNKNNSPFNFGFKVTDAANNMATCAWTVAVNEAPGAITALVCNDNVQLSLDEDCNVCMGADQVLEGGPYHCYDDYAVEVKKTANGPWVVACLGNVDINKTYEVRVRDLRTPFNTCWGEVSIEDKLAPKLVCPPVTLPCNADVSPKYTAIAGTAELSFGPGPILDNQTLTLTQPFSAGGFPAIITDVNVGIDITHTWIGDVTLRVKSPAGTTVNLWSGFCATADNLFFVADDQGANSNLCVDYNTSGANLNVGAITGTPLSLFNGQDANGTWTVTAADGVGGDQGTLNNVTLFVAASAVPATYAPVITDNCKVFPTPYTAPMVKFNDAIADNGCAGVVITRTWVATDQSGNSSTCNQIITLVSAGLDDVVLPPSYDGINAPFFDCSLFQGPNGGASGYPSPSFINGLGLIGSPQINGSTNQGYCDINFEFEDVVIDVCDGTYKILRTWTVLDWCTGEFFEYKQVVKVVDNQGPSILVDADVTTPGVQAPDNIPNTATGTPTVILTTDYYQCCSKNDAPALIVGDNCSDVVSAFVATPLGNLAGQISLLPTWPLTWQVTFPNNGQYCFPVGTHTFTYNVKDDCGNTSTKTQRVIVRDYTPPVAICQQKTTVAVGTDDPYDCYPANGIPTDANEGGIVWVPAESFNSGSYDNCANILLTVRRMAPYSDCINQLNPQDGDPFCDPNDFFFDNVSEYGLAISENDSIKFYCCEVGTTQMVILRVYELDANDNFVLGPDNQPIFNECMVEIDVQDKIKPFCQAPANKTVNCDEFDPLVWYGNFQYGDNCCISDLDTSITYVPNQIAFEQCNYGQVRRTFVVKDCNNNSSRCTQTITVNYKEQYRVYFPDDKNLTVCNTLNANEEPVIFGENCELIGISHEDQIFNVVPDACYKILRTWTVINWCTYNPNLGNVVIPNSTTSTQGARVWIGEGGPGNLDWANYNPNSPETPTVGPKMFIYPAPLTGTANNQEGTPSYSYTQVIKVQDATPPQANIDPIVGTANYTFCDYSTNDPQQWNEDSPYNPYGVDNTWSPACQSHDLCEGIVDLSILATDACSDDNLNFRYLLFLDLNGDGVMETTINSEATASAANNFNYGFGLNETEKVTIAGVKYLKGVVTRDFESDDPDHTKYAAFALPYGAHKIKWIVEDRCGNDFTKEFNIIVKDCKNPTVVCINGLAVNGMNAAVGTTPAGVTVWATDFLQYAEDNCTDADQLVFAIRDEEINPGTGFPIDPATGGPQIGLTWGCSQLGTNPVQLWAKDKAGNADYCWSYLILTDNTDACNLGVSAKVAGDVKTSAQFVASTTGGVAKTKVQISANAAGLPSGNIFMTPDNGHYNFTGLPISASANVTPTKDVNPLNGVDMFDVVRMSKHVLNIQPLTTGYEFLAADINNNKVVTTSDIVELRKLILGIYTDFPANTSWRFVEKTFNFNMATNPLTQGYKEFIQMAQLQSNNPDNHFVAVKVGDLTGDVISNNLQVVDDRTNGSLLFSVNDKEVVAGEEFTVIFKASEIVSASQFTLTFNGLTALEIVPGVGTSAEYFALYANENAIAAAIDSKVASEFSVKFRADKAGSISSMLGISNRITKAVAFNGSDRLDVSLQFRNGSVTTISGVGFELYQNQPNPFVEKTFIGFNLPEATSATLTVFDAQGKVLSTQKSNFNKGLNQVAIDRATLNGAGLVYYTLETATETATRKMIIMD